MYIYIYVYVSIIQNSTNQAKSDLADLALVERSAGPSDVHTHVTNPYPGFVSTIHVPYHVYHRHHSHPYPRRAKSQLTSRSSHMHQSLSIVDEENSIAPIHFSSQSNVEAPTNPTDAPT